MKAIIVTKVENANAVLPDLTYDDPPQGGFTLVGNVPMPDVHTCLVLVHTSEETLDAMVDSGDYLFVEEVAEPAEMVLLTQAGQPPHQLPGRAAVVQWLRDHGYSPALLNARIPPGAPAHGVRRGLRELHLVSEVEYDRAR